MKEPIFVHTLSENEREALEAGLRSKDAFVLRRCQILLASDRAENAYQIARSLGCNPQRRRATPSTLSTTEVYGKRLGRAPPGGPTPSIGPSTPKEPSALAGDAPPKPQGLWQTYTSLWTLELAAQASFEEGLTEERVSGETIRARLARELVLGCAGSEPSGDDHQPRRPPTTKEKRRRDRLIGA